MDVAKILANSPTTMTREDVGRCFEKAYSQTYIANALATCCQLGLAKDESGVYNGTEELRADIKRASRNELYVAFQACMKNYAPFLLYVDFASKGYDSAESAARAKGILKIKSSAVTVEKSLRRWGAYSDLVEVDRKTDKIKVKIEVERLTAAYVAKLLGAFEAELKAKLFLMDMLGPNVFAYLDDNKISLDELTTALLEYENDPREATTKATRTFELFLWRIGQDANVNVSSSRGPIELADGIKAAGAMLVNHNHICHGIGALRNMSHHNPDKETGQSWNISKQGALLTTLLVPATIRSLWHYCKEKKQEF